MNSRLFQFLFVLCCITSDQAAFADTTSDQEQVTKKTPIVKPKTTEKPTATDEKKKSSSPPKKRDPFKTTDEIRSQASKAIPQIRVLGIATDNVSKPVAIIDVQGAGVFFVRPGDKISLRLPSGNSSLIVTEITDNNAVLKISSVGDELIIR